MEADPEERRVRDGDEVVVRSQPPERQATDVAPMTRVLAIGITLTIVGFLLAWLMT